MLIKALYDRQIRIQYLQREAGLEESEEIAPAWVEWCDADVLHEHLKGMKLSSGTEHLICADPPFQRTLSTENPIKAKPRWDFPAQVKSMHEMDTFYGPAQALHFSRQTMMSRS